MNETPAHHPDLEPARSFDLVADAYDRGRPSYPDNAVDTVLSGLSGRDTDGLEVLELGAGTGKLTALLVARGCTVTATDPSEAMLTRLVQGVPQARAVAGRAEQVPIRPRSADLVVAAQAFHWFDSERALREVARVLRPGGQLAVLWNTRDERIPWVKRLGRLIGSSPQADDPVAAIDETGMFETVERVTFRFWQPMTQASLRDLVASRSAIAVMGDHERERVLRQVDELYEEYGRGHDGMLLPYVTTVCRSAVLPWALPAEAPTTGSDRQGPATEGGGPDDDSLLIDFR